MVSGAYDSYNAYELMCNDFLPLIDQHSKRMRDDLQALERGLDLVITTQKEQFSDGVGYGWIDAGSAGPAHTSDWQRWSQLAGWDASKRRWQGARWYAWQPLWRCKWRNGWQEWCGDEHAELHGAD